MPWHRGLHLDGLRDFLVDWHTILAGVQMHPASARGAFRRCTPNDGRISSPRSGRAVGGSGRSAAPLASHEKISAYPHTFQLVARRLSLGDRARPPAAACVLATERALQRPLLVVGPPSTTAQYFFPMPPFLNRRPSSASALRWRPSTRHPEVSRSSRRASAGARGSPTATRPNNLPGSRCLGWIRRPPWDLCGRQRRRACRLPG